MPPFVHAGPPGYLPGAGNLGAVFSPFLVTDPSRQVQHPDFTLSANVPSDRFQDRRGLAPVRGSSAVSLARQPGGRRHGSKLPPRRRCADLRPRRAPPSTWAEKGGPAQPLWRQRLGQSCLLARRLVEAGTRFVQVNWYGDPAWLGWDVHGADLPGLERMESPLCPRLDQGLSALLDDLQHGACSAPPWWSSPASSAAPALNNSGGRDHWPQCFSVLLAGAGVPAAPSSAPATITPPTPPFAP